MSLLLDALKRAENSKKAATDEPGKPAQDRAPESGSVEFDRDRVVEFDVSGPTTDADGSAGGPTLELELTDAFLEPESIDPRAEDDPDRGEPEIATEAVEPPADLAPPPVARAPTPPVDAVPAVPESPSPARGGVPKPGSGRRETALPVTGDKVSQPESAERIIAAAKASYAARQRRARVWTVAALAALGVAVTASLVVWLPFRATPGDPFSAANAVVDTDPAAPSISGAGGVAPPPKLSETGINLPAPEPLAATEPGDPVPAGRSETRRQLPAAAVEPTPQKAEIAPPENVPADAGLERPETAVATSDTGVTFTRLAPGRRHTDKVSQAYQALRGGNLTGAETLYRALLAAYPDDIEAHKGLATVAARQGRTLDAAAGFLRALALDPKDAEAQAGLLTTAGGADYEASLSRLRNLIAVHPDQPFLPYALGNLLASRGRWPDAQKAYYDAHRVEPNNAVFAFNLAVALEHLRQPKLAADFYRKTLILTETGGADAGLVDSEAIVDRLAELSGAIR